MKLPVTPVSSNAVAQKTEVAAACCKDFVKGLAKANNSRYSHQFLAKREDTMFPG